MADMEFAARWDGEVPLVGGWVGLGLWRGRGVRWGVVARGWKTATPPGEPGGVVRS